MSAAAGRIIAGCAEPIERCRTHPLARALRLDKLQLAAFEATLRLYRDHGPGSIPALAMLGADQDELRARAQLMAERIGPPAAVERSAARPGGGPIPLVELEGPVRAIKPAGLGANGLASRLRSGDPPIVARILEGKRCGALR
ncbi:MAG: hypothetical protein ACRDMA_16070 [Solirubrobacterales bacterium]